MLRRRAAHFFDETQRVQNGIEAWREGRLEDFGRAMSQSCHSSITQYECGTPAIHDLQEIVSSTEGVIGSRFGGGGFGGCVIGFVTPPQAEMAAAEIKEAYVKCHPEVADQAAVYVTESSDGVRFL
jgi:galactokinase/galacturonokinase